MGKAIFLFIVYIGLIHVKCDAQQHEISSKNDTIYSVQLKEVDVMADRKWANDTARYRYNQMKYYVTTILPYLNAATAMFTDINTKLNDDNLDRKERKRYINSKQEEIRTQYEDKIQELNITQGILLTKLISRQTNVNIYKILLELKNPFTAIKWQTWAKIHGLNLNDTYDPEKEKDLEQIMTGLNYPLPSSYQKTKTNQYTNN